jgi:hypothetical protein
MWLPNAGSPGLMLHQAGQGPRAKALAFSKLVRKASRAVFKRIIKKMLQLPQGGQLPMCASNTCMIPPGSGAPQLPALISKRARINPLVFVTLLPMSVDSLCGFLSLTCTSSTGAAHLAEPCGVGFCMPCLSSSMQCSVSCTAATAGLQSRSLQQHITFRNAGVVVQGEGVLQTAEAAAAALHPPTGGTTTYSHPHR